ncbi:MAG: transposase [Gammaproteobacteria bacterium]|nr:transposase [Gammaproteobacteria bacterium]
MLGLDLMTERQFGVTRACGLIGISRPLYGYRSRRPACAGLQERIAEIAALKRRYGYRRVYTRLRREGWAVNRKRVYRLYREAGLAVRRRKRKRAPGRRSCWRGSTRPCFWWSPLPCAGLPRVPHHPVRVG